MPGVADYFSTHTVTARRAYVCECCKRSIDPKTKYVRVSGGSAGMHWSKSYHPDCHAELFPLPPMTFEKAETINTAAVHIGLALVGVVNCVSQEHIAIIRTVTLAQMESAKEQIEASNSAGRDKKIRQVCAEELLQNVKRYADGAKFSS